MVSTPAWYIPYEFGLTLGRSFASVSILIIYKIIQERGFHYIRVIFSYSLTGVRNKVFANHRDWGTKFYLSRSKGQTIHFELAK